MFNCDGARTLENNCKNKVEKEFSLCDDCKKEYYGDDTKKRGKWTLAQMQEKLRQWGNEYKEKHLKDKLEDDACYKNIRDTLL